MNQKKIFVALSIVALVVLFFASCRKEKFFKGTPTLTFSTDTLTFDTVFTTIGSTTGSFKIYNPYSKKVRINHIYLQGGSSSMFRLNIDGKPGSDQTEVDIEAHDSIYVFVAVTVDPNKQNTPLVVHDNVIVEANGNQQQVTLQAWGQDVYIHANHGYFKHKSDSIFFDASGVWKNDKPHLVLGVGVIPGGSTITIQPGAKIFMHSGAYLLVFGKMTATGTKEDSIVFQGDRLEHYYDNLPGQWGGIQILRGSQQCTFTHVIIKNATDGIVAGSDTASQASAFNLTNKPHILLDKCVIKNCDESAVFSFLSDIDATNCLFYNCNKQVVQLLYGGISNFKHCTIANYSGDVVSHNDASLRISNWAGFNSSYYLTDVDANFKNCIIYGGLESNKEITIDQDKGVGTTTFNYLFDHCIIRTDASISNAHFVSCFNGASADYPSFADYGKENFRLQASSVGVNSGLTTLGVVDDLNDKVRDAQPDMGCFEN